MALPTAEEYSLIRADLPILTNPSDADLNETFGELGGPWQTIRRFLRIQLATLTMTPATMAVSGEFSQSTGANIAALQARLAEVEIYADREEQGLDPYAPSFGHLNRVGWAR